MTGSKKRHNRGQGHITVLLCVVLFASCENPMVNYILGERPDTSPVALWNGTWYYSLQDAVDAVPPGSPELIQIRRDITSASTMGSGGIVLGGKNIRLEPYVPDRPRITIKRWSLGAPVFLVDSGSSLVLGNGITINGAGQVAASALVDLAPGGSFTMEGGSVVTSGRNSGPGGGVYIAPGGSFTMKDSAIVSDTDVYLAYDTALSASAKIHFTGALTAFPSIARITPENYIDGLEVLTGDKSYGTAENYKHLDVTPDAPPAWGGQLRHWRVNSAGCLENVIARRMVNGAYEYYTSLYNAFTSSPNPPSPANPFDPPIPRYIELVSNVDLSAVTVVEMGYYINLSVPAGAAYTIKRTAALASNPLIRIQQSASLTLGAPAGSALIIDGGAKWDGGGNPAGTITISNSGGIAASAPLIEVSGASYAWAELVLNDRVFLQNNDHTAGSGSRNGGAVFVEQGSFSMNGGTITHNRCAGSGGGIYFGPNYANDADLPPPRNIRGGRISENHAEKSGGGISLALPFSVTDVEVKMTGGEITGNRASGLDTDASSGLTGFGGGVFIPDVGTLRINKFIMSGGRISGNISDSGQGNGVVMDGANNPSELFELSGAAYIDYSDDVLLHYLAGKHCYITLNGSLSASPLRIRINLDSYPASGLSRQVLSGTISPNLSKFEVGAGALGSNGWITIP
ncbi:MAG: hypothetical protein LBK64_03215 [Spirochaetaceae bacterium]|jgi:hypothetical protein|nr:hypothetical protein [Spirochaetaceae bacterium]